MKKKSTKIFIVLLLVVVTAGAVLFIRTRKNNAPSSTQTVDQFTNWKLYQNEKVSFTIPSQWIEKPLLIQGSGYTQEFTDPEKKYNVLSDYPRAFSPRL